MDLQLLLCLLMISPIFGDTQIPVWETSSLTAQELMDLDRGRSAWNFGGRLANKRVAITQWSNRERSVPGVILANRKQDDMPNDQLAYLLSSNETPLVLKRNRRSADLNLQNAPQPHSQRLQMFNGNQRNGPFATRKHYANHVGNGKNPLPQSPVGTSVKVPATVIAPPKFDKADLLSMLMGSGGVNPGTMGSVLATSPGYVRIGRGLPNSSPRFRKGRNLNWYVDSNNNQGRLQQSSPTSQQPSPSSSNHIPSITNFQQQQQQPTFNNQMQLPASSSAQSQSGMYPSNTPTITLLAQPQQQQPSNAATPPLPLIVSVQITPAGSRPSTSQGPVITVPVSTTSYQTSQQMPTSSYQPSYSPPKKSKNKYQKYSDYWKPVYSDYESVKPQKPYKYEYYSSKYKNEMAHPSETKQYFNQMKPIKSLQEAIDEAYKNSDPFSEENDIYKATIGQVPTLPEYYYESSQNTGTPDNIIMTDPGTGEGAVEQLDLSSFNSNPEHSQSENKPNKDTNTLSFVVKKRNKNRDWDTFDSDVQSDLAAYDEERSTSSSGESPTRPVKDAYYFDTGYDASGARYDFPFAEGFRNYNTDGYYYSLVKKLAGNIVDPIIINVPKEGALLTNEVKK